MELSAVILARAVASVESYDLNPFGKLYYPDLARKLVERYGFQKFPQLAEDFDETKGVTFANGRFNGVVIDQLMIFTFGTALDTRTTTSDSKSLLTEAFQWLRKDLGIDYSPTAIRGWLYASQLTFHSKARLTSLHPALEKLCSSLTDSVRGYTEEVPPYETTILAFDYDQLRRKHPVGRFSIQRRDNVPFSDNKYFSDAPLETEVHIRLLEELESALLV